MFSIQCILSKRDKGWKLTNNVCGRCVRNLTIKIKLRNRNIIWRNEWGDVHSKRNIPLWKEPHDTASKYIEQLTELQKNI